MSYNVHGVTEMSDKLLRLPEVKNRTGLSRSTIYNRIADGTFPKSVSLGQRAVGWIEAEVDEWIKSRIEVRSYSESRAAL